MVLWLGQKGIQFTGEVLEFLGRSAVAIPVTVFKGLKRTWASAVPSKETVFQTLRDIGGFFKRAPESLKQQFNELVDPTYETIMQMTNDKLWIAAFRDPRMFTYPKQPQPTGNYGPQEWLLSLDGEDRERLFVDYVDKYIPKEVQQAVSAVFRDPTSSSVTPDQRRESIIENKEVVTGALDRILGIRKPDDDDLSSDELGHANDIARKTLRGYFFSGNVSKDTARASLKEDFRDLRREHPLIPENLRVPTTLIGLTPDSGSHFRGLLQMYGEDDDFKKALSDLDAKEREQDVELSRKISGTQEELERLTGETERRLRTEAQTVSQIFRRMNGFPKLAIIVAGIYAAWKYKGAALALAGVYAYQAFLLKQKRPEDQWGRMAQGVAGALQRKNEQVLVSLGKTPNLSIGDKAILMERYLNQEAHEGLTQAGIGYALLAEMPLKDLARFFDPENKQLKNTDQLKNMLRDQLRAKGHSDQALAFFDVPKNQIDVADALEETFYHVMRKNPGNYAHLVTEVEEAQRREGQPYDELRDPAATAFKQLVEMGRANAPDQTLQEFIRTLPEYRYA
jgi:hypothetical protein